ncbi:MAG: GTP-dependent dephospho-CoA kinase family protein [Nitrososphaerota archaeon]
MLIVVGDFSARELSKSGVHADVYVVDGKVERKTSERFADDIALQIFTKNPAGTISIEAVNALKEAIRSGKRTIVYVDGEEDLLTLPAIMLAPLGSMVVYGQPGIGVVSVDVTEDKKREICAMLKDISAKE